MNPFGKTEFQKAMSAMSKAESSIAKSNSRVVEIDDAIARTLNEVTATERRMDGVLSGDEPLSDIELSMDAINLDRERLEKRVEEYQRMRARLVTDVMCAKVDVLAAEQVVQKAQRSFYENLAVEVAARCVAACKEPLRELWTASAAVAYHQSLPRGELPADQAFYSIDLPSLVDAAMACVSTELLSAVDVDSPPKNAPPIRAVKSTLVSAADRSSAQDVLRSGAALTSSNWTRSLAAQPAPAPGQPDNRYHAGQMETYWTSRIEVLEGSIEHERKREYPVNGADGRAFNPEGARNRRIEDLMRQIVEAKENALNWKNKLPSAA